MAELALGTVQFGLNYGVTNTSGELTDAQVSAILAEAKNGGITTLDTAADYGTSQERLGRLVTNGFEPRYVTKFSLAANNETPTAERIYAQSLRDLNVTSLHGLLFHKLADLEDPRLNQALEVLREAKAQGYVSRIGVSVYNHADLERALQVFPELDIVQLPANVLDTALLDSDLVSGLKARGCEVHVRSMFLQGILLTPSTKLPDYFAPLVPALEDLENAASRAGGSVLELLLQSFRAHPNVDAVVVGALSSEELQAITRAWASTRVFENTRLPEVPRELLDPRNWPAVRIQK